MAWRDTTIRIEDVGSWIRVHSEDTMAKNFQVVYYGTTGSVLIILGN